METGEGGGSVSAQCGGEGSGQGFGFFFGFVWGSLPDVLKGHFLFSGITPGAAGSHLGWWESNPGLQRVHQTPYPF